MSRISIVASDRGSQAGWRPRTAGKPAARKAASRSAGVAAGVAAVWGLTAFVLDFVPYVGAAVLTFRTKMGLTETYIGSYRYRLVVEEGRLLIREKRCILDMDGLKPNGRISIIL